jgi:hypothetical protein
MNKFVRRAMILGLLSLNAQAEEKVWHCEMTGHAEANMEGENKYKLEKFKMKVTPTEVTFGSGGFFDGTIFEMDKYRSPNEWWAGINLLELLKFQNGEFYYALVLPPQATAIAARCDDF